MENKKPESGSLRAKKKPWAPKELMGAPMQDTAQHLPGNKDDPKLEQVLQSMIKLGGSRHRDARTQRFAHRSLTPKAKARKKMQRRQRLFARRQNLTNRGKKE